MQLFMKSLHSYPKFLFDSIPFLFKILSSDCLTLVFTQKVINLSFLALKYNTVVSYKILKLSFLETISSTFGALVSKIYNNVDT